MTYDYYVVGGGPAGVATAYFLSKLGFKVKLFEGRNALGAKPCGGGVPPHIQEVLPIPSDAILNVIKTMIIDFEDREVGRWESGETLFYMIDRTTYLSEYASSYDVEYNTFVKLTDQGDAFVGNETLPKENTVIAVGALWRMKERDMLAQTVQYWLEGVRVEDPSAIRFVFFKDLIGYAWIFPLDEKRVKVGIGGLDVTVSELENRLRQVLEKKGLEGRLVKREGAPIDMGGIKLEWAKERPFVVGEAIGAVMPLTGEGIRPSVLTAKALTNSMVNGRSYVDNIKALRIYGASRQQVKILRELRKRGRLPTLNKLSERAVELIYKFGLGEASLKDFLKVLPLSLSFLKLIF